MQELLLLLRDACNTAFTNGEKTNWDEIRIYRHCRVGVREVDEQEKKKSFGANKSGEEMEAEKRKAEGNL